MIILDNEQLDDYLKNDVILKKLQENEEEQDLFFRTHIWHKEIEAKRLVFDLMYGDLLKEKSDKFKVLDIGGGYTSLTKVLCKNHDYTLLDFMAHGEHARLREIENNLDVKFWQNKDWYEYEPNQEYDIIITNDLFPDVDQRIELFLDKFLPVCKELRILVTYYNTPRFYATKRVDDSEILTFLSWDGEITGLKLKKYLGLIDASEEELKGLKEDKGSIYRNGRQTVLLRIEGGLKQ